MKNELMKEYCALMGIGRRFGTPWRPVEQGLVEGLHRETQKVFGMLVVDIMRCLPNEVGELMHLVEFVIYNTPGAHGYTPRDIDRRWSLTTALERELQPFQVQEFEPLDDYVRKLFRTYRDIKVKVMTHLQSKSLERAELANRFRKGKNLVVGDTVVIRDQRQRRAGGRTPYKQPLTDPYVVTELHGNKCSLRKPDGNLISNVHLEDVLLVPPDTRNLEREPLKFPEDDKYGILDDVDVRRSPGEMLEDDGALRDAHLPDPGKPSKLDKVVAGNTVAFSVDKKTFRIGKVLNVSKAEGKATVQVYSPTSDGRLRIQWRPLFVEHGEETYHGAEPVKETV